MSGFAIGPESIKNWIRLQLGRLGIAVRRVEQHQPPAVFEDPLEALVHAQGGKPAAFHCPLDHCIAFNGFQFGGPGWHPFVEAARELGRSPERAYAGSLLERYYDVWQPADAAEALIGCGAVELGTLARLPSYGYIAPWLSVTTEEFLRNQANWVKEENISFGGEGLSISAGYNHHGPVSNAKGIIEHERLKSLYRSISDKGLLRTWGDVEATMLKRGSEQRFMIVRGHHRSAVASALGALDVPACFPRVKVVDLEEAEYWPQVRRGVWSLEAAVVYFHHLFDFDSRAWAQEKGLTVAPPHAGIR
jgi:hypothetical protein